MGCSTGRGRTAKTLEILILDLLISEVRGVWVCFKSLVSTIESRQCCLFVTVLND